MKIAVEGCRSTVGVLFFSRASVNFSLLLSFYRPHWEKCAQYVEGGADRWNELSQDRSSDELVDVLLAEMTGQDIAIIQAGVSTGAEYFQGQVKIPYQDAWLSHFSLCFI